MGSTSYAVAKSIDNQNFLVCILCACVGVCFYVCMCVGMYELVDFQSFEILVKQVEIIQAKYGTAGESMLFTVVQLNCLPAKIAIVRNLWRLMINVFGLLQLSISHHTTSHHTIPYQVLHSIASPYHRTWHIVHSFFQYNSVVFPQTQWLLFRPSESIVLDEFQMRTVSSTMSVLMALISALIWNRDGCSQSTTEAILDDLCVCVCLRALKMSLV